jgi:hypothetical protein
MHEIRHAETKIEPKSKVVSKLTHEMLNQATNKQDCNDRCKGCARPEGRCSGKHDLSEVNDKFFRPSPAAAGEGGPAGPGEGCSVAK